VTDFGRRDEHARATFNRRVDKGEEILAELREVVMVTPVEDPEAWPVYGSLISDAQSAVRELDSARSRAVPPTDGGRRSGAPIRVDLGISVACSARGPGHLSTVDPNRERSPRSTNHGC
jgi:hypothetical protein